MVLIVIGSTCAAQKHVEHQQLVWYAYFNTIRFDTTWSLITEIQKRHFVNPNAPHQFLIRSQLRRKLGAGWDVAAGMCIFYQHSNDPESDNDLVVPELRPHLEFNLRQKIQSFRIEQRYKVEARFFHNTNTTHMDLEEGYTYGTLRFRYWLQLIIPLVKFNEKQNLSLKVGDEILLNVGKKIVNNVFDQNRLFASLIMAFTPSFSLEAGYMNGFQQQSSGDDYYNRDILRLSLHQVIQ